MHHRWSRTYGLDDGTTVVLSLVLVFQVLVYVYPLRMLTASFFHWMSGGFLPAGLALEGEADLRTLFALYGAGFAGLSGTLWLLHRHAWTCRDALDLDVEEQIDVRVSMLVTALLGTCGVVSALLALALPEESPAWTNVLPGLAYCLLFVSPLVAGAYTRQLRRSGGDTPD